MYGLENRVETSISMSRHSIQESVVFYKQKQPKYIRCQGQTQRVQSTESCIGETKRNEISWAPSF